MEKERLTDKEVISLKTILIEGNEKIIGLRFYSGYSGRGGSNLSPYTEGMDVTKMLEEFAGQSPHEIFGMYLRAVVNDVVYLSWKNRYGEEKIISFGANERYSDEYGVAYDTTEYVGIAPVLKGN